MWVKIHSGSKGFTEGAFLPIPLQCLLWQVHSAYSFPKKQHPYWNKHLQHMTCTHLPAKPRAANWLFGSGSCVFLFARGRIWHAGTVWTVGQLGKHRNLKTFFFFFKLTFPCPAGCEDGTLLLCPNKQAKRSHCSCSIPSQGAGNTFVPFTLWWNVFPCPVPRSIPVLWQKPGWRDARSAPHCDLQLGHPVTTHQFCFFPASSTWLLVTKGCFSWRLPAIIAAREQGFSEGHQTLGKAQSAGLRLQPQWHFSTQTCSFSPCVLLL